MWPAQPSALGWLWMSREETAHYEKVRDRAATLDLQSTVSSHCSKQLPFNFNPKQSVYPSQAKFTAGSFVCRFTPSFLESYTFVNGGELDRYLDFWITFAENTLETFCKLIVSLQSWGVLEMNGTSLASTAIKPSERGGRGKTPNWSDCPWKPTCCPSTQREQKGHRSYLCMVKVDEKGRKLKGMSLTKTASKETLQLTFRSSKKGLFEGPVQHFTSFVILYW